MNEYMSELPGAATALPGKCMVHELHQGFEPWAGKGALLAIDIAPRASWSPPDGTGFCFVHQPMGGQEVSVEYADHFGESREVIDFKKGFFGIFRSWALKVTNTYGVRPLRIVVMQCTPKDGADTRYPSTYSVARNVSISDRPKGMRLKSLWGHILPGSEAGYEDVWITGTVPRHRHLRSSAIVMVYEGSGYCGMDVDGRISVEPVSAGSVIRIPAGTWHGFSGARMRLVSAQIPDIEDDYEFDANVEYPYAQVSGTIADGDVIRGMMPAESPGVRICFLHSKFPSNGYVHIVELSRLAKKDFPYLEDRDVFVGSVQGAEGGLGIRFRVRREWQIPSGYGEHGASLIWKL